MVSERTSRPAPQAVERGIARRALHRVGADGPLGERALDEVVLEEPLEVRLAGEPWVTTMRTPGDDPALVLGLLHAEGLVRRARDVARVAPCGTPGEPGWENTIDVAPGPGVVFDAAVRRGTLVSAACGVCGRATVDDLVGRLEPPRALPLSRPLLLGAPDALAEHQPTFRRTGALHGAALLDAEGRRLASAEDVGRHNAVDKVVGRLLREERLARAAVLVVSGRVGFEIVQKAAVARVPALVAVSGPSSLAVDLAARAGLVLAAFVRGGRMNVYAGAERLD
ncbi:MAG TPA: formate dehydrogenase accessory sulfurtransferase FdhD [Polyangiaceae bacterium LLY-WYZ-15_(1-7)]|nr:formate dehydrogenase accessory sulfurtransferase FdhD [Polyangiaceae bacterium LLY-WYZ-15_(1-7)]HJL02359.1 formate dehydrogenase accessory sulfurtransferase FdhD [Polyangiaceae bacterium LLY-WYZ-15_(1-7)]HJL08779.1 formate dehydrogenase accessory sulfurtransferase FdhD [Polyangiaceae bacterium LLY-WYZ-15_(1-7)]HJL22432.1 formate dehydrogenase accessory sulfurtransferase FdhD [Polyangiaceae bacterium LLY-WYZ-15_(1-7)]HJL38632.1 formate dehydrogenase accessory sulfurtransferase FdhD [Polyangi